MKKIVYSICVGTLALALTAWGEEVQGTTNVKSRGAARGAVSAQRARPSAAVKSSAAVRTRANVSTQRSNYNANPRASAAVRERSRANIAPARSRSEFTTANRQRNAAMARERDAAVTRERNAATTRERNAVVARERDAAMARERNAAMTRERNRAAMNHQQTAAFNRESNVAFARQRNFAKNAVVTNNWRTNAFSGRQYAAFHNYQRQWHDRGWWRSHYNRIVFVSGGWWYWNAGYWFPAWGYAPYASYTYDGPIYGYNGLPPNQVVVDVQSQLQRDGYYSGPVDGALGPMTRQAIAAYQADNGLAVTSAVDEPTLASLGLA